MAIIITAAMDRAMAEHGFVRRNARWVRHDPRLPVLVFQERPQTKGSFYGFTVMFGLPGQGPDDGACFQVSQGRGCGRGHYYDIGGVEGLDVVERDFLAFTAPTAGRYRTAEELAGALVRAEIPSSNPDRGPVAVVKDLLDIASAHELDDVRRQAFEMGRSLCADERTRDDIRDLASHRPELGEAIGWDLVREPLRRPRPHRWRRR